MRERGNEPRLTMMLIEVLPSSVVPDLLEVIPFDVALPTKLMSQTVEAEGSRRAHVDKIYTSRGVTQFSNLKSFFTFQCFHKYNIHHYWYRALDNFDKYL